MAGGTVVSVRDSRAFGAPKNSIDRVHAAAGRAGTNVTAGPGALTSSGSPAVATSILCQPRTPGMSSGVPLPRGSVISTSPTRNIVWVQVLPLAPSRGAWPTVMLPASTRSVITSAIEVSSSEKSVVADGRSAI